MPYKISPRAYLEDGEYLGLGKAARSGIGWDTGDGDAQCLKVNLPGSDGVAVSWVVIGPDIADRDLGMFNALTQPGMAAVDADRDSYVGVSFSADDTPVLSLKVNTTAVREHAIPNVASDTVALLAATQTLTGKTLSTGTLSGSIRLAEAANFVLGTGTGSKLGVGTAQKLGFWNAAPVVRPSAYTQTYSTADKTHAARTGATLTDSSGGTAGTTLAAVTGGGAACENAVKDAVASLAAQVNALQADLADTALLLNAVIDDLQTMGLVG